MNRSITAAERPSRDHSKRSAALVGALGLLLMAVLAPFAQFGVLQQLIVPADAAATVSNIAASPGLFQAAIAAFLVVAVLDVVVAWGLFVLLRHVSEGLARSVAVLRVVYAAGFAYALTSLLAVASDVQGASATALQSDQLRAQVASSIASFNTTWDLALVLFGLHLVGLGILVFRSLIAPKWLGALVVIAGAGYLADSFGRLFVADYTLTISTFTFVGEALMIFWLFWIAIKGSRSFESPQTAVPAPVRSSETVAS